MHPYRQLAERMLSFMDENRHLPPEPVSGVVRGEMAVLRLLGQANGKIHAGAIADMLDMTTSRIAAVLNSLEKKEMITRCADEDDRRRVVVRLTAKGEAYRLERREEAKAHLAMMLSRLSPQDAAAYVSLTEQIYGNWPDKEV